MPAVRLRQTGRGAEALGPPHERAQHAERQVDAHIVVTRRHERPADPPGAGAEIEEARVIRGDGGESRIASAAPSGKARSRSKLGARAS
jgi:hypothetical protein